MSNAVSMDMHDLTAYSPVRVFLAGFWRLLFGAVIGFAACVLIVVVAQTAGEPRTAEDFPPWLGIVAGSLLGLGAVAVLSAGLGRMISAFARNCYFRAGREGISVRLPRQRWFGRFRVVEYWFKWNEVDRVVHFTYKTNGIPTATELRIHLNNGTRLTVDRMYFSADVWSIQYQLVAIQKTVGR
jgi:hypothetical protein